MKRAYEFRWLSGRTEPPVMAESAERAAHRARTALKRRYEIGATLYVNPFAMGYGIHGPKGDLIGVIVEVEEVRGLL